MHSRQTSPWVTGSTGKCLSLAVVPITALAVVSSLQALAGGMHVVATAAILLISAPLGLVGSSLVLPNDEIDPFLAVPFGILLFPVPVLVLYVAGFFLIDCICITATLSAGLTALGCRRKLFSRIRTFTIHDIAGTAFIGLAAGLWSYNYVSPPYVSETGRLYFPFHKDIPWLSSHVWNFANLKSPAGFSSPGLVDRYRFAYHYGAYILGASHKSMSGDSAVNCMLHFVIPLGYLCSNCVAYAVASKIWSRPAALGALLLINFCPDPASYGGDPFFSYHWLNHITPNMNYAIATILISAYLVSRCCATFSLRLFVFSIATSFLSILFKAHFFVVAGPPLATILFFSLFHRELHLSFKLSLLIVVILTALVVLLASNTPGLGVEIQVNQQLVNRMLGNTQNTQISVSWLIPAFAKLILSTAGISILGFLCACRHWRMPFAQFTCLTSITYWMLSTAITIDSKGSMEFEHRPLVLTYFLTMGFLGASITSCMLASDLSARTRNWLVVCTVTAGLCWTFYQAPLTNLVHEDQLSHVDVHPDVYAACLYLRDNSPPDSVVICEAIFMFEEYALSERRFYLNSHRIIELHKALGYHQDVYERRTRFRREFFSEPDSAHVIRMAHNEGIRYAFLRDRTRLPWWNEMGKNLVFQRGTVAVYRLW